LAEFDTTRFGNLKALRAAFHTNGGSELTAADVTHIALPNGAVITSEMNFKRADNSTGTVADIQLVSEADLSRSHGSPSSIVFGSDDFLFVVSVELQSNA
jgi:hypothetical protein